MLKRDAVILFEALPLRHVLSRAHRPRDDERDHH